MAGRSPARGEGGVWSGRVNAPNSLPLRSAAAGCATTHGMGGDHYDDTRGGIVGNGLAGTSEAWRAWAWQQEVRRGRRGAECGPAAFARRIAALS